MLTVKRNFNMTKFCVLALAAGLSVYLSACNDPQGAIFRIDDRIFPQTSGTVSGTLMMVDPDPAHGFSFSVAEGANIQVLFFKDLVFNSAVDENGSPVRLPTAIAKRLLTDIDPEILSYGVPETIDLSFSKFDSIPAGDYAVTVILDLDGNGSYDPQNDCIQFLPAGTVPVEGQPLPVAVTVANYADASLNAGPTDLVFLPGSLMCGPGEAPSTASISGNITNAISMSIAAPTLVTVPIVYLSMYYEPADFSDPSDGGTLPPDYLQPYPVPTYAGPYSTAYTLAIPYLLDADTVNLPGTLPAGNYAIVAYLSQTGAPPTGGVASGDCVGAAFDGDYSIALDDVTDNTGVTVGIGYCAP